MSSDVKTWKDQNIQLPFDGKQMDEYMKLTKITLEPDNIIAADPEIPDDVNQQLLLEIPIDNPINKEDVKNTLKTTHFDKNCCQAMITFCCTNVGCLTCCTRLALWPAFGYCLGGFIVCITQSPIFLDGSIASGILSFYFLVALISFLTLNKWVLTLLIVMASLVIIGFLCVFIWFFITEDEDKNAIFFGAWVPLCVVSCCFCSLARKIYKLNPYELKKTRDQIKKNCCSIGD
eukprot:278284_1